MYTDKCIKKRGVNLCDYAKWGQQFKAKHGEKWGSKHRTITPEFQIWADGLIQCPCWPEVDKHFAQQNLFCNLFQYSDRFQLYRFENKTHRKVWMERHECLNSYVNGDLLPKDSTWLKILDLLQCYITSPVSVPSSCVR